MPRVQAVCRSITSGRFKLDEVVLREASAGRVEATRFGRYNLPRDAASRSEGRRGRVTADVSWAALWAERVDRALCLKPGPTCQIGCQTVGFVRADAERAGMRVDPPPSFACAAGAMPLATAVAAPPDDPPGLYARFHGFFVGP